MKRIRTLLAFIAVTALLQGGSCKKDETGGGTTLTLEQIVTQGTWKVGFFSESGTDKTAQYNGNTLKFNTGGTLQVVKNSTSFTGSWNINATAQTFGINISSFDLQLLALNADWKVTAATETNVQLQDAGTQRVLHIQKL